ncbi:MAG: type II toxin-antitoxin system PemK/MazF family toxin [Acidithiobacillales bacterium]
MAPLVIARGDVFFAHLEETIRSGRVQLGPRPAVIVASRVIGGTTIIIPTTASGLRYRKLQPSCIIVAAGTGGLPEDSAILVHALREIDVLLKDVLRLK